MMNKKLIGLLVVATLGLSACGHGGGAEQHALGTGSTSTTGSAGGANNSNGSSSSNNSNNGTATTATTDTSSTTTDAKTTQSAFLGYSLTTYLSDLDVNGEKPSANYVIPTNKADINTLQVEGRSILLVPEDKLSTKDWYETDGKAAYTGSGTTGVAGTAAGVNPDAKYQDGTKTWSVIGNQLQHAKFGELYDEYEKHYRFAQGELTPESSVPTSRGQVKYSGFSTYTPNIEAAGVKENVKKGKSEFIVDFGEKSVIGQIQPGQAGDFDPITLKAVITTGNQFQGLNIIREDKSTSSKAVVQGGFYGPNAEEMAGVYFYSTDETISPADKVDGTKPRGTFGATKQ